MLNNEYTYKMIPQYEMIHVHIERIELRDFWLKQYDIV